MKPLIACLFNLLATTLVCAGGDITDVYTQKEKGYMCIRIPVFLEGANNTLLAFAEGRGLHSTNYNCCVAPVQDYPWCNDKDIVLKKSTDGGATWSLLSVIFETSVDYFYSNPTPVMKDGKILMIFTRCLLPLLYTQCSLFYAESLDNGNTWSKPVQIDSTPNSPLGGPPAGLLLSSGRVVFSIHTHDSTNYILYSDDSGKTITVGNFVPSAGGESQVAELPNKRLAETIRGNDGRKLAFSNDLGVTWSDVEDQDQLPNTDCQGSMIYSKSLQKLLFSTIASSTGGNRFNITVYESTNNGDNWRTVTTIYPGPSGYSALLELSDGRHAIIFERGITSPYETISLSFLDVYNISG